jgi:hypothetical protein
MAIDAVLSYHTNPLTCGTAKFAKQLAEKLGVPHAAFGSHTALDARTPLVNYRAGEMPSGLGLSHWAQQPVIFLHDVSDAPFLSDPTLRVIAANAAIAEAVRPYCPQVIEAFCPATVRGNPHRGAYRVLSFGMAHKLLIPQFDALKLHLDAQHPDYTVEMSTAVHEGHPWDEALEESIRTMRGIFGDKLRVLGFLGDDALARVLQEVDAVACYYVPALRANNTSYWAAVEAGKTIYTNRDAWSPTADEPAPSWDALLEVLRA